VDTVAVHQPDPLSPGVGDALAVVAEPDHRVALVDRDGLAEIEGAGTELRCCTGPGAPFARPLHGADSLSDADGGQRQRVLFARRPDRITHDRGFLRKRQGEHHQRRQRHGCGHASADQASTAAVTTWPVPGQVKRLVALVSRNALEPFGQGLGQGGGGPAGVQPGTHPP
jgi:hypothetical protein